MLRQTVGSRQSSRHSLSTTTQGAASKTKSRRPAFEALEDRNLMTAGLVGNLVIFGDSLADVGNLSLATGGAIPPAGLYSQGRFSNGPIWVDTLAEALGEAPVQPGLIPGGLDFAFGGATLAYDSEVPPFDAVPTVGEQVAMYLAGHTPAADDLFVLLAGANDFFFSFGQQGVPIDPVLPASALVGAMSTLYAAGARQFVVPNLPALGNVPYFQDLLEAGFIGQEQVDQINLWSFGFNLALDYGLAQFDQLPGTTVVEVDFAGLLQQAMQPDNPFDFANRTDAVGVYNPTGGGLLVSLTADDPESYLFFDSVHPGTRAHQLLGATAAGQVYSALGIATLTVTTASDVIDPLDGQMSLREAVRLANAAPGEQHIDFQLGRGRPEIRLAGQDLDITDDVTIRGPGRGLLTIKAAGQSRIFDVGPDATVTLGQMTLRNGVADHGGAVANAGELTLEQVSLLNNTAEQGGGIYNSGTLYVRQSTLANNTAVSEAGGSGGAIANVGASASAEIVHSLLIGNTAKGNLARGGAVANLDGADMTARTALFVANFADGGKDGSGRGGAVYLGAGSSLVLENSLMAANRAKGKVGLGGGLYLEAGHTLSQTRTTITGNHATTAGWNFYLES